MTDARHYADGSRTLEFSRATAECRALGEAYPGIQFNKVQLFFLPHEALYDDPDRDDIDILFNVSGAGVDLVRHGFARPAWWTVLSPFGQSRNCGTQGFGSAWLATHTNTGYRLQGVRYEDGLTKLAPVLLERWWTPPTRRESADRAS